VKRNYIQGRIMFWGVKKRRETKRRYSVFLVLVVFSRRARIGRKTREGAAVAVME